MSKIYKFSAMLFIALVFSFLLISGFGSSLLKTEAQSSNPLPGGYALQLNGVVPGTNSTLSTISIVGQFDISGQSVTGSRTLVVSGVGPIPGGTFTCQVADVTSNGTGKLVCQVVDAITGPAGRTDTFFYVLSDKRREMKLTLIGGVPGAVVSGTAERQ
ncbi:MAG: hypothetical protein IPK14_15845 [Blastocatellia bacterium]|nr:hypothetical protein [Blastocatellia bacterium]MBN8721896.1 hypothetical protein [Acidobacteriota bacterium]